MNSQAYTNYFSILVYTLSQTDTFLVDKKCVFQNLWNQIRGSNVSTPLTAYWLAQKTATTKNLDKIPNWHGHATVFCVFYWKLWIDV